MGQHWAPGIISRGRRYRDLWRTVQEEGGLQQGGGGERAWLQWQPLCPGVWTRVMYGVLMLVVIEFEEVSPRVSEMWPFELPR